MSTKADPGHDGDDWRKSMREASPYLGLGMQLALTMAFFSLGGYLIDRSLGTIPWLTIVGGVVGMIAVFVQLLRVSQEMSHKQRKERDRKAKKPFI